jgi:hypothetical protein
MAVGSGRTGVEVPSRGERGGAADMVLMSAVRAGGI